jgi:hypothetical protein
LIILDLLLVVLFNLFFFTKCTTRHFSCSKVSRKSFSSAQYSLLEFHFFVCVTASSPLVHFSLHIFLIPCSVVHRFLSLLLHSSVDSLSVCCSVWLDSFLWPDSHAGYFFGFHRSVAGQRLLAPFPAWCLDSRLQFWLPGFFFSLSRGSALPHAHSHAHSIPIRFFSESFCRQCSHSQLRPPPFLDSVLITVLIFLSRSCVWIVAGRSRYIS